MPFGVPRGVDCIRHYNRCHTLFESLYSLWPGTGECISPTVIFDDLLFKFAIRSDRLCVLVAGLLDAFVTAHNVQRNNRGPGLTFEELMYGRIKMMTALCPAWAHTYQTMCLVFHPEQLRPEAFRLPKQKKRHATYWPDDHQTDWCRVSRLETLHGWWLKTFIYDTEMAGWGVAVVSPEKLVRIICGPVVCDARLPAFLGALSCSHNAAVFAGFAEAVRWANYFIPRGARLRILFDSKHAARVTNGTAHAERNMSSAHQQQHWQNSKGGSAAATAAVKATAKLQQQPLNSSNNSSKKSTNQQKQKQQ